MAGHRIQLGELLVRANLVTEAQLKTALSEQRRWGGKLGEILVRMSYLSEDVLVKALAKQLGLPRADLEAIQRIDAAVLAKIPKGVARSCSALPLALGDDGRSVVVAMSDPHNLRILDELRSVTGGARVVPYLAGPSAIARAISRLYDGAETMLDDGGDLGMAMLDTQGRPIESARVPSPPPSAPVPAPTPAPRFAPPPPEPTLSLKAAPLPPGASTSETLKRLEEQQVRELQALRALVELLIERNVFSRDDYLARVRR
jgi:hypothetical protein